MKTLLIVFYVTIFPTAAFAQAAVAGSVSDRSGGSFSWRRRRSQQHCSHREDPDNCDRSSRALPHRGPATGAIYGALHARGLAIVATGRHRADRIIHRDRRCDARPGGPHRLDHRRGSVSCCRRAQRGPRDAAGRRGRLGAAHRSKLQRTAAARARCRDECQRYGHGSRPQPRSRCTADERTRGDLC